ncbi:MAG: hypothetical protein HN509_14920 [Halobacteriovoraceae bacterium]|jgi:tetratricopeptide (TPR) repeat protein|nr:hypothetical protein [Halobacteriovoraceae bacterium]
MDFSTFLSKKILADYPLDPEKLGKLITYSTNLKEYDDLLEFFEILKVQKKPDLRVLFKLADGLIAFGRGLLVERQQDKAQDVLDKAIKITGGGRHITAGVVQAYIDVNQLKMARFILEKALKESSTTALEVLRLDILNRQGENLDEVMKVANDLLKNDVKELAVYRILIEVSYKLKRREDLVDDLIQEACKAFPEKEELLKSLKVS